VRNTYIYPPEPSMRIIATSSPTPRATCRSSTAFPSPATTCRRPAPRPTWKWPTRWPTDSTIPAHRCRRRTRHRCLRAAPVVLLGQGKNFFMEIAKMRAARALWAKLVRQFNPKMPSRMALRTHSQTSGWSLTEQDPFNNVVRTCIEAMAAACGHTQSLHTNALDEAIALPTDFSARIARNTQLFLQEETGICKVIDPLGMAVTTSRRSRANSCAAPGPTSRSRGLGGMTKAIETGSQTAHRGGRRAPSGPHRLRQGNHRRLNTLRLEKEDPLEILEVDNTAVRESQIKRLQASSRPTRQPPASRLDALTAIRRIRRGQPARARRRRRPRPRHPRRDFPCAGKVFGRYQGAKIRSISGVYQSEFGSDTQDRGTPTLKN
jgi:methylmalonyl-CoA mutase